jgi:hypothetical protein
LDILIADSRILHRGTKKRDGWSATLKLVEPFEKQITVRLSFERGTEIWEPEKMMPFFQWAHLPRSHRNLRLNKLFKNCRKDESMVSAAPEVLAKWFLEKLYLFPSHFQFSVHSAGPNYSLTASIANHYHGVWHGQPNEDHPVFEALSKEKTCAA